MQTVKRKQGSPSARPGKQLKQSRFIAPFLKETSATSCHESSNSPKLEAVDTMSEERRKLLEEQVQQANDIALTLVFTDGSSQLRETNTLRKKTSSSELQVMGIALAYNKAVDPSHGFCYVYLTLESKDTIMATYKRKLMQEILTSKAQKLGFKVKDIIKVLHKTFQIDEKLILSCKNIADVCVAGWMLDPDNPPSSFHQLLHTYNHNVEKEVDWRMQVCGDLSVLHPIMQRLYDKLRQGQMWQLFSQLEMTLCPLLALMDLRGVHVTKMTLLQSAELIKRRIGMIESEAHKLAGRTFLVSSHTQLRQVLFDELKLDQKLAAGQKISRTNNNEKSTSEAVLSLLENVHPLPKVILEHRQLSKLKSTYIDGLLSCMDGDVLRTHWDQTAAATGRLTSISPNIQAIPKLPITVISQSDGESKTETEVNVRDAFVAREGYSLLAADFAQIEFRLLAHLSGDPCILDIFNKPSAHDIFMQLTVKWLKKSIEDVTQVEREQTKRVVYSVIYGAGKDRLSEYLKITPGEAKNIMSSFLLMFPGVNLFTKKCLCEAQSQGYQKTLLKRRRLCPNIKHQNPVLRSYAERQVVNFCIQGSAADICKAAMVQVEHALMDHHIDARLVIQIHDELLIEVCDEQLTRTAEVVKQIMEDERTLCGGVQMKVPLKVVISCGKKWGSLKPFTAPEDPEL